MKVEAEIEREFLDLDLPFTIKFENAPANVFASLPGDDIIVNSSTIAPNFVSFSVEVTGALRVVGKWPSHPNLPAINLFNALRMTPGAPGPKLRVGGNSVETSYFNPCKRRNPVWPIFHGPTNTNPSASYTNAYNITDIDILSIGSFLSAVNGSWSFGINFRLINDTSEVLHQLQAVERILGGWDLIDAIEIGNEIDDFEQLGFRPTGYSLATHPYYSEWLYYVQNLTRSMPKMPRKVFQGGVYASKAIFISDLGNFEHLFQNYLKKLSYHIYGGSKVSHGSPSDPLYPNLPFLLAQDPGSILWKYNHMKLPNGKYAYLNAYAQALGTQTVAGETNSVNAGGLAATSNVFGVALWAIDYLFTGASCNLSSFEFHMADAGNTNFYSPIMWNKKSPGPPMVKPLYYGMLFFARATANYSRIIKLNVSSTDPHVKVWGVRDHYHQLRIVVLHKNLNASLPARVAVRLPARGGDDPLLRLPASLLRLQSSSPYEMFDITFAGQSFNKSTDGKILGSYICEAVVPQLVADGKGNNDALFQVSVSPISAVLLIFDNLSSCAGPAWHETVIPPTPAFNTNSTCAPEELYPPTLGPSSATVRSSSTVMYSIIGGCVALFVIAAGATAYFVWQRRRHLTNVNESIAFEVVEDTEAPNSMGRDTALEIEGTSGAVEGTSGAVEGTSGAVNS